MRQEALRIEYLTKNFLKKLHENELVPFLVSKLLENSIIILEGALNPLTQSELLMRIFNYVNMQFFGIDIKTVSQFSKKEITIIYPKKRNLSLDIQASIGYLSLIVKS